MDFRRLIALLMVCAYLILPLDSFANHDPSFAPGVSGGSPVEEAACSASGSHCPCSDQDSPGSHGSDGCTPSCSCCSCCSFLAPLPAGFAWYAVEPGSAFSSFDPFQHIPEVYLTIFVPPQNLG